MKLGIVCGFDGEIACFRRAAKNAGLREQDYQIKASGSSADRAEALSKELIEAGASKLLSFGIAGAVDPRLTVGDVIFTARIITTSHESTEIMCQTEPPSLRLSGPKLSDGVILGVDHVVTTVPEKTKLFNDHHAQIIDMESHRVALIAAQAGTPFHAIRAVSDGAKDTLPEYVTGAVSKEGKPLLFNIIIGLLKAPKKLPDLLRLKRNTDTALAQLEHHSTRILKAL